MTSPGFSPSVRSLPRQRRDELIQPTSQMQAIRDRSGKAIGYELFYRDSPSADSASERTTAATLNVLAGLMAAGRGDSPHAANCYFVNVTRDIVVDEALLPDPSTVAVLEVQPEVVADEAVLAGGERLRALGYGVALDRYVPGQSNGHDDLLRFASHVKLALDGADRTTLETTVRRVRAASNALIIGCRIGSPAARDLAREIGCDLFQGYALDGDDRRLQQAVRGSLTAYVRLLELLAPADTDVDLDSLVAAVMRDADLSLRALRACNAASIGAPVQITSIHDAVVRLGIGQLRRMIHLSIAQGLAVQGEDQLLGLIEYATLAELVGTELGVATGTGFLAGLLLEIADVLDATIAQLIVGIPLDENLAAALRHRTGTVGCTLDVLDAYKRGDMRAVESEIRDIAALHAEAQLSAIGLLRLTNDPAQAPTPTPTLPPVREKPARAPYGLPPGFGPEPTADEDARADQWHRWALDRSQQAFVRGSVRLENLDEHGSADVSALIARDALASQEIDGVVYVPMWQFGTTGDPLPGLESLVRDFPGDAIALTEWITRPCPTLERAVPLALILQGQSHRVLSHVRGLGAW